jgi:two-component system cell cycle sensor histidine kinase/response regulator CckA
MKILHLEDNRADAELVRELLSDEWTDCQIKLVETKSDYSNELTRGGYDLILSDFSLVRFDGSEALKMALTYAPTIPFIFLSGNIGEDRAIEAVRSGAADYVLKDRVKRLATAIRRAIRETQERKHLHAMTADRERLAAILEHTPDFVGLTSPAGRVLYLNRAARQMIGLAEGLPVETLDVTALHPPEVVQRMLGESSEIAKKTGTWTGESMLLGRGGAKIPVSQVMMAHRDEHGSLEYFSTVMRDLTARKQTEALVNGQNQVLEMIAGGEPLSETLTTLLHFIERQSEDMLCSILLLEDDGRRLRHCAAPRLSATYTKAIDGLIIGPTAGSCGTAAFRRAAVLVEEITTDPLWADYRVLAEEHGLRACWSAPIFDVNHRMLGTFAVYRDQPGLPTEHHRRLIDIAIHMAAICLSRYETEKMLRDQASILNKAGDAIVITDSQNRVTFWNQSAARTFGWTANEAIGREDLELFGQSAHAEILAARNATEQNPEWRGEMRLQHRQGKSLVMDNRITLLRDDVNRPQGRLWIATDITDRKRIEEQFFRAQRLESLGMLAAGIAHDLNNVLAPILLAAPMLRDHAHDPSDLRMISTLEKSAERGAALVRQILGFAQGADGAHVPLQTKHLLRDIATFVGETFPKSIHLDATIPNNLWRVKANATQLHQVLLNLCVNARDAMPKGGTLTLRGENQILDEVTAAEHEGAQPGAFLTFHVEDTGEGIPPDVLARIWEPFFTTKASDKGTGLGLSTVRGIVESHSGFIEVSTTPGQGSRFRVYLPALDQALEKGSSDVPAPAIPRGTGELVLVVDDEVSIRNMSATMLSRQGYRVLTAGDGAEAIALFAPRSKEISLVITDLSMPNLDGAALAGVIRRINPEVKIIAVSGLAASGQGETPTQNFTENFLFKPFRREALLTMVDEVLHAKPPA